MASSSSDAGVAMPDAEASTRRPPAKGNGRGRKLTLKERELVVRMLEEGNSERIVANKFGVTRQAIAYLSRRRGLLNDYIEGSKEPGFSQPGVRKLVNAQVIEEMLQSGDTHEAIAHKLGISVTTVRRRCPSASTPPITGSSSSQRTDGTAVSCHAA